MKSRTAIAAEAMELLITASPEPFRAPRGRPQKAEKNPKLPYVGVPADEEVSAALEAIRAAMTRHVGPGIIKQFTSNAAILRAALIAYRDSWTR
jgi:hypothetical protein